MSTSPPSSTGLALGIEIDRYEVLSALGAGGFGQVYRARHKHTRQVVALKVLRTRLANDARALEQLFREARIMASIRHPNIVQVYDCGAEGGRAFVAMELVEGRSLDDMIFEDGSLDAGTVLPLALQLFSGLAAAHERGVIHRDIKPANLLVQANGTLKILDFGISRADLDEVSSGASQTGALAGTPGFMAPEQYAFGPIDARVDLYAAAVTLFAALSGRTPFSLDVALPALVHQVLHERAPSMASVVPTVPRGLAEAIDRGLARDPDARFQTAAEFREALLGERLEATRTGEANGSALAAPFRSAPPLGATPTVALRSSAVPRPETLLVPNARLGREESTSEPPNGTTLEPQSSAVSRASPGWVLAGVAVGAIVLVTGAVVGAFVTEARAKKDTSTASQTGATGTGQGPAVKELAGEGIIINPPTLEKTGHFTTTQLCEGPNDLRFVNATFDVKEGPAIVVLHACTVELVSPTIRAPIGVRLHHAASVKIRGGSVVAETAGIDFDGRSLDMQDTRIEGGVALRQVGMGTVTLRRVSLVGRSFGYMASSALDTTLDEVTISGAVGLSTEGGHFKLTQGSVTGTSYALDLGGVASVDLTGTVLKGQVRKRDLAEIHDPLQPPKPKPLSRDEPLVRFPGLAVSVPQVNPEGLDVGAFTRILSAASAGFRACGGKAGESIRLVVSVTGPEITEKDPTISVVLPYPTGPLGACVAQAFKKSVPVPWREAGASRAIIFSVTFD